MIKETIELPDQSQYISEKFLFPAYNSAKLLNHLVNDILDYSRIRSQKFNINIAKFNLHTYFEELQQLFSLQLQTKSLKLIFEDSGLNLKAIISDQIRLTQVLINLISSAIKFTGKGEIRVIITIKDNAYQIGVRDTGVGIKETDKDKLFKEYGTLDSNEYRNLKQSWNWTWSHD
eukprot:TRINITY_DN2561_c0_g2_i1.p1 TRINITY_DN2561_c0_g2~~TRINITY_DN2561_c0_g2_i1.p1  ORF type:complete len:175 (+),score=12.44 TRINITY_DN2561_c0_g2_i1:164-688(+)